MVPVLPGPADTIFPAQSGGPPTSRTVISMVSVMSLLLPVVSTRFCSPPGTAGGSFTFPVAITLRGADPADARVAEPPYRPPSGHQPARPGKCCCCWGNAPTGRSWAGWWPNRPVRPPRRSGDVAPVPAMRWPTTTPGYSQQPPRVPVPRAFGDPPGVAQLRQRALDRAAGVAGGLLQLGGGRLPPGVAQRLDDRGLRPDPIPLLGGVLDGGAVLPGGAVRQGLDRVVVHQPRLDQSGPVAAQVARARLVQPDGLRPVVGVLIQRHPGVLARFHPQAEQGVHVDLDLRVDAWRIPGRGRVLGAPAQHDAARPAQRAQVDQPLGEFPVAHAQHHAALIHDDSDAGTVPHSDPARLHVAVAALHLLAQLGHHLPDLVAANRDPAFAPPDPRLLALAVDVDEVVVVGQDDAGHVGP